MNNVFSGPATRTVLEKARIKPGAKYVLVHCEQGFTANLPLEEFLGEDCLFAIEHDGQPLEPDHGYPVRLVVPRLYSEERQWVRGIEAAGGGCRGVLGTERLSHARRSMDGGTA